MCLYFDKVFNMNWHHSVMMSIKITKKFMYQECLWMSCSPSNMHRNMIFITMSENLMMNICWMGNNKKNPAPFFQLLDAKVKPMKNLAKCISQSTQSNDFLSQNKGNVGTEGWNISAICRDQWWMERKLHVSTKTMNKVIIYCVRSVTANLAKIVA